LKLALFQRAFLSSSLLIAPLRNTVQIEKNQTRPTFKRKRIRLLLYSKKIISKENIPLLQILDAIHCI
jgi:hypothetical protein